ncbi:MAG: hypothetical protein QOF51_3808 [Chloroflexota bacterium]|jgi:ribosomal protein L29|nr:hypothetical protein [Chloroflexota bacterium]
MTELLQRAIAAIQELPEDVQDAIAARVLAEIADEQDWSRQFEATTDAQWDHLAAQVRRDIAANKTIPLEELLQQPPSP